MVDFMDRNKDAAIAGVQLLNPDGTKQNSIANFPSLTEQLFNKSLLRILFPKRYPSKYREFPSPIEVESVIGACMIVRFQAVQDVGKLDPGYFLFLEETDWCYQMKKKGWKIFHLPKLRALHKQGRSLVGFKSKGRIEYYRSLYRFFKKNYNRSSHLLLRVIVFTRTMVNLSLNMLAVIFTLGLKREFKEKVSICWHLFLWHLLGCPNREAQRYGSFFRI
jgi:GT2 family glycosyltransferase